MQKCLSIPQLTINEKKQRFQKTCEWYQVHSKEEKDKKQEYGHKQNQNLFKHEKQKLLNYRKKYYKL